jgi:hypothetical protein
VRAVRNGGVLPFWCRILAAGYVWQRWASSASRTWSHRHSRYGAGWMDG